MTTLWAGDKFAAADLADQMHLAPHVAPVQVKPVAVGVNPRGRAAKQLAQQNIGQGFHDGSRSALQQIGDAHMDGAGFHANETVGVGETAELHGDLG